MYVMVKPKKQGEKQESSVVPSTVKFTDEDKEILARLEKRLGLSRSGVLKFCIREIAAQKGVLPE